MVNKFFLYLLIIWSNSFPILAQENIEDYSVVFLIYHRFGEDTLPSTNIQISQFKEQIKALTNEEHSFPDIMSTITKLENKKAHLPRSVIITVDDGYKSVMTEAWPLLKENNIPLTIFIATDPIDSGQKNYLSWQDIRKLVSEGVTIAHHGSNHNHPPNESLEDFKNGILRANRRFQEELGFIPKIYAYPYGEFTPDIQNTLKELGFRVAFGQFSGVAGPQSDLFAIPRFAINEKYGGISRFGLIVNSLSLPVSNIVPENPVLSRNNNPPSFGFNLIKGIPNINNLACYPSHLGEAADISIIDENRVEVRFELPFPVGRSRINCTLPGPNGRWYWFGRPFILYN
jgi:poly-beta-1,6-N-acetyl-D-glucosamine N-deacetylase